MAQLALPLIAPPLSQKRSILDILPSSDNEERFIHRVLHDG
jgi:hypothetical protein